MARRTFLGGAAAAAAALTLGCANDDDRGDEGTGEGPATTSGAPTASAPGPDLPGDPFTLGVASGDPLADSVVLWTRLAPDPFADDGSGGMPDTPIDVVWEVARDDEFTSIRSAGVVTARPDHGHSVHVDVTGLDAGTTLHYRFRVGEWTSPVGTTATLATAGTQRLALAVVNCQWYETGAYGAYRHLLDEDIDLVVHLGDYIYEYPAIEGDRATRPAHQVRTLTDFRLRYASYKVDEHLQAAHARFPFVATWDDHEVANNYTRDLVPGAPDAGEARTIRAAAYQAWWENMPVRGGPPDTGGLRVYRDFAAGDLARFHLMDQRQYADVPPCRANPDDTMDFGDCEDRTALDRTLLGSDQERWLGGSLGRGGVTWNILASPMVVAGVDAGSDQSAYYLETWDGYPRARERLLAQMVEADNPVILSGDYHQGMALDVHRVPHDPTSEVIAPEFMAPPISSVLFSADAGARNPHLRQQVDAHGYMTVEITPEALTTRFRVLDDVNDADTAIRTRGTWTVNPGNPTMTGA